MDNRDIKRMRPEEFQHSEESPSRIEKTKRHVTVRVTPGAPEQGWVYRADETDRNGRPLRVLLTGTVGKAPRPQDLAGVVRHVWTKTDDVLADEAGQMGTEG